MRRCRQSSSGSSPRRSCRPVGLPLPEAIDHGVRKPVAELPRQQNDLPAVMRLVRHEVREDVPDVERQVAPHVAAGRRHVAARRQSECEETFDAVAAAPQCRRQLPARDMTTIDAIGTVYAVLAAKRPDPAAARIVQMGGDHPVLCAAGTPARRLPTIHLATAESGESSPCCWFARPPAASLADSATTAIQGSTGRADSRCPPYFAGVWSSLRNRAALL